MHGEEAAWSCGHLLPEAVWINPLRAENNGSDVASDSEEAVVYMFMTGVSNLLTGSEMTMTLSLSEAGR
jgi:hypothetical protein